MESAKNTAMMDLYMLNRISLSCGKNKKFVTAFNFILLRDYCLVFDEILRAFKPPIKVDNNITKIRQNIKLFGQRGSLKNGDIYMKIREIHTSSFASYENNIGLFMEDNRILGSTIYNTFIFLDSDFENPYLTMHDTEFKKKLESFLLDTIPRTRMNLEPLIIDNNNIDFYKDIPVKEVGNSDSIKCFDVRSEKFFDDQKNLPFQTLQFRLLICLQELNYIIYIFETFIENNEKQFIDNYTFMRILTRGLDSILKNINNLWEYSNAEFMQWLDPLDEKLRSTINVLASNKKMIDWASKYRNMIHYDTLNQKNNSNFIDVMSNDSEFESKCYEVYHEIVLPLQKGISQFFIVTKSQQYSLLKMLVMKIGEKFNDK